MCSEHQAITSVTIGALADYSGGVYTQANRWFIYRLPLQTQDVSPASIQTLVENTPVFASVKQTGF
jgi:hypothetical protein